MMDTKQPHGKVKHKDTGMHKKDLDMSQSKSSPRKFEKQNYAFSLMP